MKRTQIKLRRERDVEPSSSNESLCDYNWTPMVWSLFGLLAVVLLLTTTIRVAEEKITLNENLYKQCTNTCAQAGKNVIEANDYQAQCIGTCNYFYTSLMNKNWR